MLGWEVIPRIGIGNLTISPHGLGIALGYFAGTLFMARRARSRDYDEDHVWNVAAIAVIGAIVGARLAYVAGHYSEFDSPAEWLEIWKGGISLVGALLGAFFAAYLYTLRKGIDFFQLADLGMAGLALGIGVGRIGDLVIGDHLGKETSGWWGWEYKGGELISPPPCIYDTADGCIEPGLVVHQTALYDMVWSLLIFAILVLLDRKPRRQGFFLLTWACLYAVGRIVTDFTRVDKRWFGSGLTGSQLTALAALLICGFLLARHRGTRGRGIAPFAGGIPSRLEHEFTAEQGAIAGLADSDAFQGATPLPRVGMALNGPFDTEVLEPEFAPAPPPRPRTDAGDAPGGPDGDSEFDEVQPLPSVHNLPGAAAGGEAAAGVEKEEDLDTKAIRPVRDAYAEPAEEPPLPENEPISGGSSDEPEEQEKPTAEAAPPPDSEPGDEEPPKSEAKDADKAAGKPSPPVAEDKPK